MIAAHGLPKYLTTVPAADVFKNTDDAVVRQVSLLTFAVSNVCLLVSEQQSESRGFYSISWPVALCGTDTL